MTLLRTDSIKSWRLCYVPACGASTPVDLACIACGAPDAPDPPHREWREGRPPGSVRDGASFAERLRVSLAQGKREADAAFPRPGQKRRPPQVEIIRTARESRNATPSPRRRITAREAFGGARPGDPLNVECLRCEEPAGERCHWLFGAPTERPFPHDEREDAAR